MEQKEIEVRKIIQTTIILIAITVGLLIWPFKLIRPWQYMGEVNPESTAIVKNEGTILQQFIPVNDYLRSLEFYVYEEDGWEDGKTTLYFRLFDAKLNVLELDQLVINSPKGASLITVPMRGKWKEENVYYFSIENPGHPLRFAYSDGVNMDVQYGYRVFFTKKQYFKIAAILFLIAVILCIAVQFIFPAKKMLSWHFLFRIPLGTLVIASILTLCIMVYPAKIFTNIVGDILFYEFGLLAMGAALLYGIFRNCRQEISVPSLAFIRNKIADFIQILSFAGVMVGCVNYANAVSVYQQSLASNQMIMYFGLAILMSFSKREIITKCNIGYLIAATGAAVYYCLQNNGTAELLQVAERKSASYIIWGLVLLCTIRFCFRRNRFSKTPAWIYTLAYLTLIICFISHRFKKIWPIQLLVFGGIFSLRILQKDERSRYLRNFAYGAFVHFIYITIWAWCYRPFHYYMLTRYAGIFHTATSGALYFGLIAVMSFVILLEKTEGLQKQIIKQGYVYFFLLELSLASMLLTASRTGIFSVVLVILFLIIVFGITHRNIQWKKMMRETGIILLFVAVFFVSQFTMSRIIPSLVDKPYSYDYQLFSESIKEGENKNSFRYVTVEKFFTLFSGRVFSNAIRQKENATSTSDVQNKAETDGNVQIQGNTALTDYSNGRLEVFQTYWSNLNWEGHENVELKNKQGQPIAHAHNAYLQVAYDFGIGIGIYFLCYCIFFMCRAIYYYMKKKDETMALMPMTIIAYFGVCGMVEWVMIPYIPTGFALFFILTLMIPKIKDSKEEKA